MTNEALVIPEGVWRNSSLSVARHYGEIKINKHTYIICDKRGIDIFTLSKEAEQEGRAMAIEAGEPADLVRSDFIPTYKKYGRELVLEALKGNPRASIEAICALLEEKTNKQQSK